MKRIKIFENFIGESHEQLYEIFESIDIDHDVEVSVLPLFDSIYFVQIFFGSKVNIEDILKIVWEKINLARNMGYNTHSGFENAYIGGRGVYGSIHLVHLDETLGFNQYSQRIKVSDKTFSSDISDPSSPLNDQGIKFPHIFKDLDIYSKINKTYKVSSISLYFDY